MKKPRKWRISGVFRLLLGLINASRTEALCARPSGRTEQISSSEALDITVFRAMADFFVSAINYFFFLVIAQSLPRILI